MKRTGIRCLALLMILCILCGCDKSQDKDAYGNASIHADWEFVESTVNGNTMNVENDPAALKIMTSDVMPRFSCPEGDRCEFSMNNKTHRGVVTDEGPGRYRIHFNDGYKDFLVEISGERMTLANEEGTVSLVFKVKKESEQ